MGARIQERVARSQYKIVSAYRRIGNAERSTAKHADTPIRRYAHTIVSRAGAHAQPL